MKKEEKVVFTPFANLAERMAKLPASAKKRAVMPKGLRAIQADAFADMEDIGERKIWLAEQQGLLNQNISVLAEMLKVPELAFENSEKISEFEKEIREFILDRLPRDWPEREAVILSVMEKMIGLYPATALQRIADMGVSLGFFTEAGEKVSEQQRVRLPVTRESGRGWGMKDLTTHFPGSKGLLPSLKRAVASFRDAKKEGRKALVAALREGTVPFFVALEKGGEAAVFVPSEERERDGVTIFYPSGHLRIRVEKGFIFPVDAVGAFAKRIKAMAEAENVSLLISQISEERLNLRQRLEEGLFRDHLFFHILLKKAWKEATRIRAQKERSDEMRKGANVHFRNWLLDKKEGTTFLRLRQWTVGREPSETFYENVEFVCERVDGNIRVTSCLPEHEELFKEVREFMPSSELRYPLSSMLKVLEGAASRFHDDGDNEDSSAA